MSTDLNMTDELLMAYVDGELDAEQAERVEQAMRQDVTLRNKVAQQRALRTQLQQGLSGVLAEPVPTRLLDVLQAQRTAKTTDNVVDLADKREQKTRASAPRWQFREWGAMAASLVAGIVIGVSMLNSGSNALITSRDGSVVAQGQLADALSTQLASHTASSVHIGVSFRNREGHYCRSFVVQDDKSLAGLACHEQDSWRVQMLTEANAQSGEYRQAGSTTPSAVLALIEQQIAGEPLDARAEVEAVSKRWK